MIRHIVELTLQNANSSAFYDFMVNPRRELLRQWLPEEHREFRVVKRSKSSPVGDLVYYDEILGSKKFRLVFYALIIDAVKPHRIVFQMRKFGLNLPAFLDLEFEQDGDSLKLKHEVRIGGGGFWRLANPLIKHICKEDFFAALKGHCDREWVALQMLLDMEERNNKALTIEEDIL